MKAIVLLHVASTLFMTGVIWMVQVVHYPLFAGVGTDGFPRYSADHARLIGYVVIPAMLAELGTAVLLTQQAPLVGSVPQAYVGLGLLLLIWGSTFLLQVPLHGQLSTGYDPQAHRMLVATNWVRTALWSARAGLVLGWLGRLMPPL